MQRQGSSFGSRETNGRNGESVDPGGTHSMDELADLNEKAGGNGAIAKKTLSGSDIRRRRVTEVSHGHERGGQCAERRGVHRLQSVPAGGRKQVHRSRCGVGSLVLVLTFDRRPRYRATCPAPGAVGFVSITEQRIGTVISSSALGF